VLYFNQPWLQIIVPALSKLTSFLFRRLILRLLLFHSRVIVHEDERSVVFGVRVALRALVAGTEIALLRLSVNRPIKNSCSNLFASTHRFVIIRQLTLHSRLLRALPWPLRTVWADQHPAAPERIESAVRDVVEDCVRHIGLLMVDVVGSGGLGSGLLRGNE
jgi:hypothetical protein